MNAGDSNDELARAFQEACPPDYHKFKEAESDAGNARRFVIDHGKDLRYVESCRRWFVWNGFHFRPDDTNQVTLRAVSTARAVFDEAKHLADIDNQRRRAKHALSSQHYRAIRAMLELASAEPEIAARAGDFDADPDLLGVANGVLDLRRGELVQDGQRRLISKSTAVAYDPAAECPLFRSFIEGIFADRADLVSFIEHAVGYSLTGRVDEQILFLLIGGGANGKTTLTEILFALMGDYAARVSANSLLLASEHNAEIPNDIAALVGRRFVSCNELEQGRRLREARVKELTGSDTLTARFMRGEWFAFRPMFKVWLAGNHLPRVRGADLGIWRRMRLIEFGVTIMEADQDRRLPEKLRDELPGILAWAVRAARAWYQGGVETSGQIRRAGERYKAGEDLIGQFIAERCSAQQDSREPLKDLTAAYNRWASENAEKPISSRALGTALEERGCAKDRGTANVVMIKGLRLHA